jgi:hypothetical protein
MEFRKWLGAAALALLAAQAAYAADDGEWQFSGLIGQGRLHVDADRYFTGEVQKNDTDLFGVTAGYKLPAGALFEAGYAFAEHADFGKDEDIILKQYWGSVGWQFESSNGWRFKPRVGLTALRLYSDARLLLDDDGTRHFWQSSTAPFVEASVTHRLGPHFSIGANYRETFPDFGKFRWWGLVMTLNF